MKKIILSVVFALGIVFSDTVYFEYTCITDENWPRFLGFPFVQSTNSSWVFSMSGELFLLGLVCNILFWTLIVFLFLSLFKSLTFNKFKIIKNAFNILLIIVSLFVTTVYFSAIDWRYSLDHDNFKMNYYEVELDCQRVFHFFN